MIKQIEAITGAEWNVMRIVWSLKAATTKQVITMLQQSSDWKDSTIKTLLARLVKKGALATKKQGHFFIYSPVIDEQTAMNQSGEELFNRMCVKRSGQTLIDLVEKTKMTQADLQELARVIQLKLQTAPTHITCNCLPDGSCE